MFVHVRSVRTCSEVLVMFELSRVQFAATSAQCFVGTVCRVVLAMAAKRPRNAPVAGDAVDVCAQ
eukprot:2519524-Lingulodinium_polyedra.AAC.1